MNRHDLLARVETVCEPPYLPLYLTTEEYDTLKPAFRQVASYGHRIAIKAVDADGYAYAAYQVGPRPAWETADWGEDDQRAYEANLVLTGYKQAARDVQRLFEAAEERGLVKDGHERFASAFLADMIKKDEERLEAMRKQCRSRRLKEAR